MRSTIFDLTSGPAGLGRGAPADVALHGHVAGRLGEREVVREQAGAQPHPEHRVDERLDRAAQVGHGQPLVHREPLDLVEHRAVRGVERVVPVAPARADHVQRQRAPGVAHLTSLVALDNIEDLFRHATEMNEAPNSKRQRRGFTERNPLPILFG